MIKKLAFLASVATLSFASAAGATEFVFEGKGNGDPFDAPVNAFFQGAGCGTAGDDICDIDNNGLAYSKDGYSFTSYGFADGSADTLIQDLVGPNQGHGVLSEGDNTNDQINAVTSESVLYVFDNWKVKLSDIALNDGVGNDCPGGGAEGNCGTFSLYVDGALTVENATADAIIAGGYEGKEFEFFATGDGDTGFSIERFTVSEVPVPAALPLFLGGLAMFNAFSRRRKK